MRQARVRRRLFWWMNGTFLNLMRSHRPQLRQSIQAVLGKSGDPLPAEPADSKKETLTQQIVRVFN